MKFAKPLRITFLGAPGSGKGTQTTRLLKAFPLMQSVSSGDTIRAEVSKGTALGEQASQYIDNGKLVPDSLMVGLIKSHLEDSKWLNSKASWLLDGFPRTLPQAQELDKVLRKHDADLTLVVELDVDQSVILDRIENRWVHESSGRVYNLGYNSPKVAERDDITGEKLVKRLDDTSGVFQKRLEKYNDLIGPLREFYAEKGILRTVKGDTSDIIFPKLKELVEKGFM